MFYLSCILMVKQWLSISASPSLHYNLPTSFPVDVCPLTLWSQFQRRVSSATLRVVIACKRFSRLFMAKKPLKV